MDAHLPVKEIISRLEAAYPEALCSLEYESPWRLLVAVRLAAQCTDERVNKVTPALFERFPTPEAMASAEAEEVEKYIRSCGFFRTKARDLVLSANMLLSEFGGVVPGTMEELLRLPGVGRKTANLILGDVFERPSAVVADTHCIRLANRMGLARGKEPEKVEQQLRAVLPPEKSNAFCHRMVLHGRAVCTVRSPRCAACTLEDICPKTGV